jgi:HAD superfamily hydrolase (TIGR01490 family)
MIAAIFDLDGTLYTGHIGAGIIRHHRAHKVNRLPLAVYLAVHTPVWWAQRAGLLSEEASRAVWTRHMGWTVRGWTTSEARQAFRWIAQQYVEPLVREDMIARLRDHQAAGHRTILVSGTLDPLLAEIGRQLGIDETVGTPLVMRSGRYTGASERPVCQGLNKALRLEAHLGVSDDIVRSESYAYADSHTDIPLLERFGHPVAVYPDARLAAHARRLGWQIIGSESEVHSA